jgi:hypothetical protein
MSRKTKTSGVSAQTERRNNRGTVQFGFGVALKQARAFRVPKSDGWKICPAPVAKITGNLTPKL